ncbi:purine-nucleoside phosphorylase [Campylobacter hepaticus]|uniref:Purine-nucleoside phosphorylase n=1 Tax=Campylobacter hepaticus TaxID=1813019 RepID=A0A6A7JSM7_9BACT|nr:purine-nucleoside phosphorylase [Campylobacter hepaticus]AXP09236.1 purine-nucleoside phosphorylase [Campylobacter hepaticus]MCZ0771747.1 purine-nucleoside phosphorylase [Campylobacter hepaticus]MCZ0773216.1 purine-nucleoside phosphorylase [Campylobacter hepaticus]MCZ0775895.1 purine-nucleoside phosphorylase [Campylobacter hepaticus]MDX2323649.1 purine-nucleoside phosphorylase [Campylobacter hepaticus]
MIVCAGGNENFSFAKPIGIGLVESAFHLTQLCLKEQVFNIIFIGTCGLYKEGKILEIYKSSHAFNIEFSQISHAFYTPTKNEIDITNKNVSRETIKINSSNYICQNSKAAKQFAKLGFFAENMEAFSVLSVAQNLGIEAECILCATNFCNENAHKDFIKNHEKAKEKLTNYLKEKHYI